MNCKTAMGERYMIGLMLLLVSFDISGQFGGGTGTKENPYLIINQTHLSNIKNYLTHIAAIYSERIDFTGFQF